MELSIMNISQSDRMLRAEERILLNSKKRRREIQRNLRLVRKFIVTICVIMTIAISFGSVHSYATQTKSSSTKKYYRSICVMSGESLESIANEYMSVDYRSKDNFISEVKSINNLKDDSIHAGEYLIIPYYE